MTDAEEDAFARIVRFVAIAVVAGLLGWGIWQIAALVSKDRYSNEQYAEYRRQSAEEIIQGTCLALEPPVMADCIRNAIQAAEEAQRAQSDLSAQQQMATWALALLFVTLGGVVLIGWTLLETYRARGVINDTLQETKRQADAATKTYVMAHRPWLVAYPVAVESVRFVGTQIHATVVIAAENKGQFPAINVEINSNTYQARTLVVTRKAVLNAIEWAKRSAQWGESNSTGAVLWASDVTSHSFSGPALVDEETEASEQREVAEISRISGGAVVPPRPVLSLSVGFCVVYKSLASDQWHHYGDVAIVRRKDGQPFDPALGDVSRDDLHFSVMPGSGAIA